MPERVAPVVLVSPAMAIGSHFYAPLVAAFEERGWDARATPRRGFERGLPRAARGNDWSYRDEIDDLAGFVAESRRDRPERPVIVLGHSLGGHMAVGHDHLHTPVDGIVTVGSGLPHPKHFPYWGAGLHAIGRLMWPLTAAAGHVPKPVFGAPGAKTLMREWARMARGGAAPFPVSPPLTTPALLVQLEKDSYAVAKATAAFADLFTPASTTRWRYTRDQTPPGGTTHHIMWVKHPEVVVDRIIEWWDALQR